MRLSQLNELKDKGLISQGQADSLAPIITGRIVSVFYELRVTLYLGVMLFTTGVGILIYKNIGDLGHVLAIAGIFVLTAICFSYAFKLVPAYNHGKTKSPTPYFDYIILLGSLLLISDLGYLQFQYEIFNEGLGATTLVTAAFFFYVAYRFDHLGVLSLAITAFASFWSITISPQKWYSGEFLEGAHLYNTALVFSCGLSAVAIFLDYKGIKKHFTFTYINFSSLVFFVSALTAIFANEHSYGFYLLLLYAGCVAVISYATKRRSFLFMLYACIAGYIGTTFLLADFLLDDAAIWFLYLLASCGGFVYFIISFKSYFKRTS
jgi:hypothetical protein